MENILEYKCPCCGGAIAFDSTLQKLKCPYCDTEFEPETLKGFDDDLKTVSDTEETTWEKEAGSEWNDGETDNMSVFVCNSCGGEIIGDSNTAATSCPYCGNPVVIKERLKGMLKPDLVIPFKLDKEAAKKAYERHIEGKRLLPKIFKDKNHIDEIKGVYVPFWLFDTRANADIRYKATRIRAWCDSRYNYTETSYFSVLRSGTLDFEGVPVDGSAKIPDDLMESLEPFNLNEAVDFQTAYLAGYLADKYDVDSEKSKERAGERIRKGTEQTFMETVHGFVSVVPEQGSINLDKGSAKYAMYPVWLLNTTYEGQKYTFAMNGQTGKFVGNLPYDKSAGRKWFFGVAAAVAAVSLLVQYLAWLL